METEQQSGSKGQVQYLSTWRKPNEISLVPYSEVNGSRTVSDDRILQLARDLIEDGYFQRVFIDGPIDSPEAFLESMKNRDNLPVFSFRGQEMIGVAWLNSIEGTHATAHFCFLKKAGADALRAGSMTLAYWMAFEIDGVRVLDVLMGAIPESNMAAIRFSESLGFVRLGRIPNLLYNRHTGEKLPAVLLYYTE